MAEVIHTFIRALHTHCMSHDMQMVCLRPYDFKNHTGDIDLLARKKDMPTIIAWIRTLGITVYDIQTRPEGMSFFIYYKKGNAVLNTQLDFTFSLQLFGLSYLTVKEVLHRAENRDGILYTHPTDQCIILLYTYLMKHKKNLKPHYKHYLARHLAEYQDPVQMQLVQNFGSDIGTDIFMHIKNDTYRYESYYKYLYLYQAWKNEGLNAIGSMIWHQVEKFLFLIRPKTQFICFLGVDGAGKTYLIRHIRKNPVSLSQNIIYAHFLPAWPWHGIEHDSSITQSNPHARKPRNSFISALKMVYYLYRYWFVYLWPSNQSKLYVFDRYLFDILIDPMRFRYHGPAFIPKIICRLLPQPVACIHVDINSHTAQKRKSELPYHETARQASSYRDILPGYRNYLVVDGDKDIDQNTDLVINHIIRSLSGHAR